MAENAALTSRRPQRSSVAKPVLFGVTLFVGAAMLFCVQPMIAKLANWRACARRLRSLLSSIFGCRWGA